MEECLKTKMSFDSFRTCVLGEDTKKDTMPATGAEVSSATASATSGANNGGKPVAAASAFKSKRN
jgi:hypothetical protein